MKTILSYTRAQSFNECPSKFKAQYIDNVPRPSESHTLMGSLIHEVADRYVTHLKETKQGSDFDQVDAIAKEIWDSELRLGLSPDHQPEYLELVDAIKDCLVFDDIGVVSSCETKLAVTKDWAPCGYESDQAYFRGKLDRVDIDDDGNVTVIDYKAGRRVDAVESSNQLKLYASMAASYWPSAPSIRIELIYLRFKIRRSAEVTPQLIGGAKTWILELGQDIEKSVKANNFPATPGLACRSCVIFKTCTARKESLKLLPPNSDHEAKKLVGRLVQIELERESIKKSLAPWIEQRGSIESNGMQFGYYKRSSVVYDPEAISSLLAMRGLRPTDYLKVDNTALDKLAKKDDSLKENLQKLQKDKSTTELRLKRYTED